MELFLCFLICAGVWCGIKTLGKREDANRQAKATAREMKKAFSSDSTQSSFTSSSTIWSADQQILNNGGWKCTNCGKVNSSGVATCLCGHKKEQPEKKMTASEQNKAPNNSLSTVEQLKQGKELFDTGAISLDEYEALKKKILGL